MAKIKTNVPADIMNEEKKRFKIELRKRGITQTRAADDVGMCRERFNTVINNPDEWIPFPVIKYLCLIYEIEIEKIVIVKIEPEYLKVLKKESEWRRTNGRG